MDIQSTRVELAKLLLSESREAVLKKVGELLSEKNETVAYTTSGEPLTQEEYNKRLEEAEADIQSGRVVAHEELKKRVKSWGQSIK